MHIVQNFGLIIWCCFILIMLSFAEDNEDADVIKQCMNSTNSTSCSLTYEHVYKSLTKSESSFNISHALYPEGAKPSLLVRVNVYGPNRTSNSVPAKFTWSIHCLYANAPALLLEMLSLSSVFVTFRTQELNIQTPVFCCNISDDKQRRQEIIQGFLTRAVFDLQDLAVISTIRDPSVNTAECVIQGHEPGFATTGRSHYIRAMLWLSMFFVLCSGPLLAKYVRDLEELKRTDNYEKKNTVEALCFCFYLLSVPSSVLIIAALVLSFVWWSTFDIPVILIVIMLFSLMESLCIVNWCIYGTSKCSCILKICGGHVISYICLWLIIGIRVNPTWGLTIALLVVSVSSAVTYAKYLYLEEFPSGNSTSGTATNDSSTTGQPNNSARSTIDSTFDSNADRTQAKVICVAGCLATLLLFIIVILAGHSHSGKEMAVDEVLKATSLYFITAFISWATWKKHTSADASRYSVPNTQQPGTNENLPYAEDHQKTYVLPLSSRRNMPQPPEEIRLIERSGR